jgi:WD40 repeat protein
LPPGAYVTGDVQGLGEPNIINRRDFIYALAFAKHAHELAFVHHVSLNMELTTTAIDPVKPRFQAPVNSSEYDVEDVIFLEDGPGKGSVIVPSRQGVARAFDETTGAVLHDHTVGVPLVRVAASPSGSLVALGTADGRVLLLAPGTLARMADAKPFTDEVRGLAFLDDKRLVAASFDGTLQILSITDGAEPLARLPSGPLKGGERAFLAFLDPADGNGPARGISTVRDSRQPVSSVTSDAVKRLKLAPVEGELTVQTASGPKNMPVVDLGKASTGLLQLGPLHAAVCDECVPGGAELALGQDVLARATFTDDIAHDEVIVKPTDAADHATVRSDAKSLVLSKSVKLPGPATDVDVAKTGAVVVSFSTTKAERSFDLNQAEKDGMYPAPAPTSGAAMVDVDKGTLGATMVGHKGFTVTAAISPDGRTVATGGWDRRVLVFDAITGKLVTERELGWLVRRVRFSPDGHLLGVAAWTPVNVINEGNSDPALLLYPLAREHERVATR